MTSRLMPGIVLLALLTVLLPPAPARAGLGPGDLPEASSWYVFVDFESMRSSAAGRDLHAWLDREVFDEIREENGVDLAREADRVTAVASGDDDVIFVLEGKVEQATKDKLMAYAAAMGEFDSFEHRDRPYFFVRGKSSESGDDVKVSADFEEGMYFSLALDDRIVATATEARMQELLDNRGRIKGVPQQRDALLVLSAERSLIQAGADVAELARRGGDDDDWDSNFLRNARQVALVLADAGDKLAIEAQMIAIDEEKANALASIARGLIALQAFSDDLNPDVRDVLTGTTIDVADAVLKLKLALDPKIVVATLDD